MTRVFYASTLFGAMTLAAAIDAGRFGPRRERRLLVVSCNTAIPEIATALHETPAFAALRSRFDEIRSWNEVIAPLHPSDWRPRALEVPLLSRLVAAYLGLDGPPSELVCESIAVPPARAIAGLLRDCPITVYADGLMSYGPTRDPLPLEISCRLSRLLHLDLVPGLAPLLLREYGVPAEPVPDEAFTCVVRQVADLPEVGGALEEDLAGTPMILGQYLSALEVLTAEEEAGLHADMLAGLAARGHTRVIFKPHPGAGPARPRALRRAAEELGVRLVVVDETVPAEVCFAVLRPALVVSCFSTGLVTARRFFGLPVATVGCELLLERLTPYENSNRVPATVVDATVPRLERDGTLHEPGLPPKRLGGLVEAVGYCMQSAAHPGLREAAERHIAEFGVQRYFKRRRLAALDLLPPEPEPDPAPEPSPVRGGVLRRLRRRFSS